MPVVMMTPYKRENNLHAIPYPRYGVGVINDTDNENEILSVANNVLGDAKNGATFTLNSDSNNYMYFVSRVEHGLVTFTDTSNNFQGGWDGAQWPVNVVDFFTETGPVVVQINGENWYLYRTDFKGIGNKTYSISFETAQLDSPTSSSDGFSTQETAIANAILIDVDGPVFVGNIENNEYIAFRYVPSVGNNVEGISVVQNGSSSEQFVEQNGKYYYVIQASGISQLEQIEVTLSAVPIPVLQYTTPEDAIANAIFAELNSQYSVSDVNAGEYVAFKFNSLDDIDHTLTFSNSTLSIYRRDNLINSGLNSPYITNISHIPVAGAGAYEVFAVLQSSNGNTINFEVEAQVVEPPNPRWGIGAAATIDQNSMNNILTNNLQYQDGQQIVLNLNDGQYGYFAIPKVLGEVGFSDRNNFQGAWDGAPWPLGDVLFDNYGPVEKQLSFNGYTGTWLVYRTDFDGITETYTLDFKSIQ